MIRRERMQVTCLKCGATKPYSEHALFCSKEDCNGMMWHYPAFKLTVWNLKRGALDIGIKPPTDVILARIERG